MAEITLRFNKNLPYANYKNVLRQKTYFVQNVLLNKCVFKCFLNYLVCSEGRPADCFMQVGWHKKIYRSASVD